MNNYEAPQLRQTDLEHSRKALKLRIAQALTLWMSAKRLSPTDLHKRTGVARNTLYKALAGDGIIATRTLYVLARELGATIGQIVDGVPPSRKTR